jgi:trimethylamine--corrinoid protein Co-methyltransferase
MRMAARGQAVVVSPFTLAGAMAPVTLAGAIAQQTAEALAAIVLLQHIRPGAPVVMGAFTSNVDMRSGAPAFGTPEYMRAAQMSGQMARFYGLPLRSSNACAANCPDAQAAWESAFSLWGVTSARANMVYHAAGWLEGGLCAGYEKFVMDCETLQQMIAYNRPVGVTEADLAVDAIAEVGPTGHFFGVQHTQDRYETAFYAPFLSDWRNYEAWAETGGIRMPERALALWKTIVAQAEPPPLDEATAEALADYVVRRKAEGGAPTDF